MPKDLRLQEQFDSAMQLRALGRLGAIEIETRQSLRNSSMSLAVYARAVRIW